MKKANRVLGDMMTYVMLNCDKATFLVSKSEFTKLGCVENIKLKMHLMTCSACRLFVYQSKYISRQITLIGTIDPDNLVLKLSENQKKHLNKVIDNQINHS